MSSLAQTNTSTKQASANGGHSPRFQLEFLDQAGFTTMLRLERKRTERSNRRFVLMLLKIASLLRLQEGEETFNKIVTVLANSTRETDIKGWHSHLSTIGVIFTEIGADSISITNTLLAKITNALGTILTIEQINLIEISFHDFPENGGGYEPGGPTDSVLYLDLEQPRDLKRSSLLIKRGMDITGGLLALALCSPFLVVIALIIKLTSKGPVFFRQERVGQYGRIFTFLKFRSMYCDNDHTIHKEYVKRLIAGKKSYNQASGPTQPVYKLLNDPRITPFGRFLRKTSIDEIPQFLNVVVGSMSLVGPRPPIPYEFECYEMWHRQRVVMVKPGITGEWQVGGRSKTTFDEMVRMDIQYSKSWTVWGDIKILLQTPRAVLTGAGAY